MIFLLHFITVYVVGLLSCAVCKNIQFILCELLVHNSLDMVHSRFHP